MSSTADKSPPSDVNKESLVSQSEKKQQMQTEQKTPPSDTAENAKNKISSKNYKWILPIIIIQIVLIVLVGLLGMVYAQMHNIPTILDFIFSQDTTGFSEAVANYNFVGVGPENPEPSLMAVLYEVFILSFAGVLARQLYYLTQTVIRHKETRPLELISKFIGEAAMGVAIAVAVVAFLWSTEFVNLTLRTADIGAIVAISFIIGFYHEDTRRLLGSFREKISGTAGTAKNDKESE
jgi:hypothetical protein